MAGRYTKRVTPEKIAALQAQGLTEREARQRLRGHATTPEHGKVAPPTRAAGRQVFTTRSSQAARRILRQAAAQDARVSFAILDRNHPRTHVHAFTNPRGPHTREHNTGISARYLWEGDPDVALPPLKSGGGGLRIRGRGEKPINVKRYLEATQFGSGSRHDRNRSPGLGYYPEGITEIQITVYGKATITP